MILSRQAPSADDLCGTRRPTFILYKMKVALMRQQLRRGDVLKSDRVVRGVRDDGIALRVVMGRGQESSHVRKDRPAYLDCIRFGREIRNGDLTKIRYKNE